MDKKTKAHHSFTRFSKQQGSLMCVVQVILFAKIKVISIFFFIRCSSASTVEQQILTMRERSKEDLKLEK